jgi:hypothetical protein
VSYWNLRLLILAVASLVVGPTALAGLVVGGFDGTRAGSDNIIDGSSANNAVASLLEHFPDTSLVGTPQMTPAFLEGVDILVLTPAATLSAAEQAAFLGFVNNGGRALLLADGYGDYFDRSLSYLEPLGVWYDRLPTRDVIKTLPIAPSHPVIDGPFGVVAEVYVANAGMFTGLGPYAHSLIEIPATSKSVFAVIEQGALGPNSGRIAMFADSNAFLDPENGGSFFTESHIALFLNSINFLAVPEPSSLTLVGAACAMGGVFAGLRRIRMTSK